MSDERPDDVDGRDSGDDLPDGGVPDEAERQSFRRDQWDRRSAEKLWLVSYSDFMTIMMIFFLAMFGYSHMVEARREKLRVPLAYPEFAKIVEEMKKKLGDQVRLEDDMTKVTVELGEDVLFPSGSAVLNDHAKVVLGELAASINRVDGDIIVEGHTDDVPIATGKYRSNWELSAARSFSVVDEFSRAGIPPQRLAAWGFGENRPLVKNEGPESRFKNRRIDIVVLKRKPPAKA